MLTNARYQTDVNRCRTSIFMVNIELTPHSTEHIDLVLYLQLRASVSCDKYKKLFQVTKTNRVNFGLAHEVFSLNFRGFNEKSSFAENQSQ